MGTTAKRLVVFRVSPELWDDKAALQATALKNCERDAVRLNCRVDPDIRIIKDDFKPLIADTIKVSVIYNAIP